MQIPREETQHAANMVKTALTVDGNVVPMIIKFRIKGHQVDYSIANRPEPTLTGISDAVLLAAFLHAGRYFERRRIARREHADERVERSDGRTVTYKEIIELDFEDGKLFTTRGVELTLKVLSVIVSKLAADVARTAPAPATN